MHVNVCRRTMVLSSLIANKVDMVEERACSACTECAAHILRQFKSCQRRRDRRGDPQGCHG